MRPIRSWPRHIPNGRSYVVDSIERLVIENSHYADLLAVDDDVLLLEWDIAVSKEDLHAFRDAALDDPSRVIVAPYRIYYEHMLPAPIWAHRRWDGSGAAMSNPTGATPVDTLDPTCNLFGLGLAWLPRDLVRAFMAARFSAHFGDVEFSMWHHANVATDVPIFWDARPVHLNYRLEL